MERIGNGLGEETKRRTFSISVKPVLTLLLNPINIKEKL